jgi:hypothetical protein
MRKNVYKESKQKLTLTVTPTVLKWLEEKQTEINATSLSDTLERLARGIT